MSRNRASIDGGYARKTVSLPAELAKRIEEHLAATPGLTMSSFISIAAEDRMGRLEMRKMMKNATV